MSSFGISPYSRSISAVARMASFEQKMEEKKEDEAASTASTASTSSTSSTASTASTSNSITLRNSMKYAVGHRFDTACDHF